ncbi:MAG: restriction endonuclease subunit S [Phycisphaerales bacterium]
MGSEWSAVPLGEVASVRSGYAFKSRDWTDSGVPVVKIANVKAGRLDLNGCSFVTEEIAESAGEFNLELDDIVIAMTGYIGETARVQSTDLPCVLNQRVGKFKVMDSNRLDPDYLYAFLSWKSTRERIEALGYGSAQPNVSPKLIHQIKIPLPPMPKQQAIAEVLGSLDDKIELNRRMNRTLESMARALFKSWFVDFDPVHANAAGKPTLPPKLAALFPDRFDPSRIGDIPEGWEVRSLDEIANYLNGLALQKYPAEEGEPTLPRLKIAQLRKGNTEGADLSNTNVPYKYIVQNGDVIFSWSGSLLVRLWTGGKAALNQHLFKVSSDEFPRWFFYLWTQHHLDDFQATAAAKATTMGHIQRHHLSDAKVIVPPASSIASLDAVFSPIIDRLVMNDLESRNLSEIRDSLLGPLLSGDMQINMPKGGEK